MAVNVIFSLTNGGEAISDIVDHGNVSNGSASSDLELYLRHDGANSITNAGLYIRQKSGTYSGSFTASDDFAELLEWGDAATESAFGGFHINFNAEGTYAEYAAGWPTYDNKSPSGGYVFRTGVGDSEANAITIPTTTGATSNGTIQAGNSPNVRYKVRGVVPDTENVLGIRQWDTVCVFNFTS